MLPSWTGKATTLAGCLLVTAALAADQPPTRTAEPAPPDGPAVHARGVVVTPDGRPISGATVVLRAKTGGRMYVSGVRHNRDILARTTTDADGRFAFDGVAIPPRQVEVIDSLRRGQGGAELLAWAWPGPT
jgi:hypothetical protein